MWHEVDNNLDPVWFSAVRKMES